MGKTCEYVVLIGREVCGLNQCDGKVITIYAIDWVGTMEHPAKKIDLNAQLNNYLLTELSNSPITIHGRVIALVFDIYVDCVEHN